VFVLLLVCTVLDPSLTYRTLYLQIPGFSSYLHAIEIDQEQLMLGIGQHVDPNTGRRVGVKISLFDINNPKNPMEIGNFTDEDAYSNAQHDFKSFRYLPLSQKLILPKREYTYSAEGNFDGFVVYDVSLTGITPSHESKFQYLVQ